MKKFICKLILISFFITNKGVSEEKSNTILEINPLLMVNQGLGINYEQIIYESHSIGIDIEIYKQNPFASNIVEAKREIYSIIPKWQYYIFSNEPLGLFVSLKTKISFISEEIFDKSNKINKKQTNFSPVTQFGYRFTNKYGLTFGIYVGSGIKLFYDPMTKDNFNDTEQNNQEWIKALSYLQKNNSKFIYEYGLIFGYLF